MNEAAIVDELVSLCNPQGQYSEQTRNRVRQIGESIFRQGGNDEMMRIHEAVASRGSRMHGRILEGYWGGIGDWWS